MNMKQLLAGFAALPFLASAAIAGQPAPLSDTLMDGVAAGLTLTYSIGTLTSGCSSGGTNCGSTAVKATISCPICDGSTGLSSFGKVTSAPTSVNELTLPH
jgi:hypothetical protein